MEVKTKEYNVYQFNELENNIKDKVIEKWYEQENYSFLDSDIREEFLLQDHYFSDIKLNYSLGYSQGDGLSFEGIFNLDVYLKENYPSMKSSVKRSLSNYIYNINSNSNSGRYCFSSINDVQFEYNCDKEYLRIDKVWFKVFNDIQNYYIELCKKLEKYGYDILEYRMNHKEFNNLCNDNEYNFLEDGKMVNY